MQKQKIDTKKLGEITVFYAMLKTTCLRVLQECFVQD